MTAKQYLNQARWLDERINKLLQLVSATRDNCESITQNYNSDGTQATKNPHKFDRLVELESSVDQKVDKLIALKAEILETISQLKDNRQQMVLIGYYLNMKTWEQVAVEMNYSYQHTMRIHGYALREVEKILNQKM